MDIETIKLLLSTQEKACKGSLELMMKQVFDEIGSLRTTTEELKRSLEFTQAEVADLKQEVKNLEKEKAADKSTIEELKRKYQASRDYIEGLGDRCDTLEDYSRRNNIHITGMEELPGGETWEQTADQVKKLFADKM